MKEDSDIILQTLRVQLERVERFIGHLQTNLKTNPPNATIWHGLISANEHERKRLGTEIARRSRTRKPPGRRPAHAGKIPQILDMIKAGTDKKKTAKQLGISRSTLYRLLSQEDIHAP